MTSIRIMFVERLAYYNVAEIWNVVLLLDNDLRNTLAILSLSLEELAALDNLALETYATVDALLVSIPPSNVL